MATLPEKLRNKPNRCSDFAGYGTIHGNCQQ
jgi:hypothetical protein